MKNKNYHSSGTIPKYHLKITDRGKMSFGTISRYHLKITDRGKMIDTPNTQIGDRSLSCLVVGTTIESDGVQLVLYNNVYDFFYKICYIVLVRQNKALIVLIFVSLKLWITNSGYLFVDVCDVLSNSTFRFDPTKRW